MDKDLTEPRKVVLVNPADVNLADTKALAAEHDCTVVGAEHCRRGTALVIDGSVFAKHPFTLGPIVPPPREEFWDFQISTRIVPPFKIDPNIP